MSRGLVGSRGHPAFVVLGLLWAALIWWATSRPTARRVSPFHVQLVWNGGHAAVFAILSLLLLLGLPRTRAWSLGCVVACIVYGAVDEWHQGFVPGRVPSVTDWITDACGVGLGLTVLWWLLAPSGRRARAFGIVIAAGAGCLAAALAATIW